MLQSYIPCGEILVFIIAVTFVVCAIKYISLRIGYKDSVYFKSTKRRFHKVLFDKGAYGEYLTSKELKGLNPPGQFLFNVYLTKDNGETTELDVVLIHQSGIYVFESKNYSGWVFGGETQRQWTQTLNSEGKTIKNHFFNPIMQNELHIKWLKNVLLDYPNMVYHSFILFSDRCTLKKIELKTDKSLVINRHLVRSFVSNRAGQTGNVLSPKTMQAVYDRLYPFTQVSDTVKQKHVDDIIVSHSVKRMSQSQSSWQTEDVTPESPVTEELKLDIMDPLNKSEAGTAAETVKRCPRCGKVMVLRMAKKGENAGNRFWGCSGFPQCRYTENVAAISSESIED